MTSLSDPPRPGAAAAPTRREADPTRRDLAGLAVYQLLAGARRHWLFLALLGAGTVLRAIAFLAYQPALIYFDSTRYLENMADLEPKAVRPLGYPFFLKLLPLRWGLEIIPLVQHLFGLFLAALIYALLLRLGVRRWLAALASAPVLLDAQQLNIEQQILSEPLFELFLLGGCACLLWQQRLGPVAAGLAGLCFAGAALTRSIGLLVIVPAALTVLFLRARPSRLATLAALLAAFALPVAAYATWFHSIYGVYGVTSYGGRFLYARVAPFVDCSKFSMPSYERVLCPKQPVGQRPTVEQFTWVRELSPVYRLDPPPGKKRNQVAGDFAKRVVMHQPLTYARVVGADFVRGFYPTRTSRDDEVAVSRWQFQLRYPVYRGNTTSVIRAFGDERGRTNTRLASFLHAYQRVGYVPGPVLGAGLVLGLLAAIGIGRAKTSGLRSAAFLFSSVTLAVLLGAVAISLFSWRYQLPQLILLPPALVLGLTALTGWRLDRAGPEPDEGRAGADAQAGETR